MADLSTTYLGMKLKNPIIVSSCNLTDNLESIKELEANGAAAVVLKSIFEEEITMESNDFIKEAVSEGYDEGLFDYYDKKVKQNNVVQYLKLIEDAKKGVDIPVIASINCMTNQEWVYFAKKIQYAGADALELNMFILPSQLDKNCQDYEDLYLNIINRVLEEVSIPVTIKISLYFSNLASVIQKLSKTGIKGIVLFNKFFYPDFDIETEKVVPTYIFSNPQDFARPLRWISIMSERVDCDLSASTGIHSGESVIKLLLAGTDVVQIASTLIKNGPKHLKRMLSDIEDWMESKGYSNINDFRSKLCQCKSENPALYERVQFMKYFGNQK